MGMRALWILAANLGLIAVGLGLFFGVHSVILPGVILFVACVTGAITSKKEA
jgi:hypothetical protein